MYFVSNHFVLIMWGLDYDALAKAVDMALKKGMDKNKKTVEAQKLMKKVILSIAASCFD